MKSDNREIKMLKDVTKLIIDHRGKTPKKMGGDWSDNGYRALSARHVKTGEIVQEETIRHINSGMYKKWMKDEIERGDILITSEAPFGEVYYWDSDEKIVLSQRLFGLRIKEEYYSQYIYYYMISREFQHELDSRATGTTVRGLRQPELLKCEVKVPSFLEQKAIADTLSSLDDKIENNNKINENLEEQAQAIFKHWFLDFEFPDEEGNPYKSSGGEMIESELGMIPKGWEVVKLGDKFNFIKGKVPKYVEVFEKNAKPYLNKAALDGDWSDIKYGLKDTGVHCKILDVLMMMDGASSSEVFYGYDGLTGSTLSLIEAKDDNIREILYMYFSVFNNELKNQNTGSAIPHANKAYIDSIKIAIPELEDEFTSLSETFKLIRVKVLNNQNQNQKLSQLRDTLLPKLMSGEIRIPLD